MITPRVLIFSALAVAATASQTYAGPCSDQIDAMQARIDAKLEAKAAAGPTAKQSVAAGVGMQPTPASIATAEEKLGDISSRKVKAIKRGMARGVLPTRSSICAHAGRRSPPCSVCSARKKGGDDPMRVLFVAVATAAALCIGVPPAQAQAVPDSNVDPVCHGIAQQAADPSEKGGPDLAFSKCVQSEQAMRQKTHQRMVDVFADGEVQLHRRANGGWRAIRT